VSRSPAQKRSEVRRRKRVREALAARGKAPAPVPAFQPATASMPHAAALIGPLDYDAWLAWYRAICPPIVVPVVTGPKTQRESLCAPRRGSR
jgi:hypothetical protein